ncbi:MAG: hypothetical protein R3268_07430 [Acidiferrobacterales bacterium]|nr:hypothetical protein [Acidiferrobacterales bacterium]
MQLDTHQTGRRTVYRERKTIIRTNWRARYIAVITLLFTFGHASPLDAADKPTALWIDLGTGFTSNQLGPENSDISVAAFVRYRISHWEIIGGGWYSDKDDVSNLTVGGGYVVKIWRGLNFTGGFAVADKSANIGTQARFYFAGRWDFRCWSIGYLHFSNGESVFHHGREPNEGVNLIVGSRKLHC